MLKKDDWEAEELTVGVETLVSTKWQCVSVPRNVDRFACLAGLRLAAPVTVLSSQSSKSLDALAHAGEWKVFAEASALLQAEEVTYEESEKEEEEEEGPNSILLRSVVDLLQKPAGEKLLAQILRGTH